MKERDAAVTFTLPYLSDIPVLNLGQINTVLDRMLGNDIVNMRMTCAGIRSLIL